MLNVGVAGLGFMGRTHFNCYTNNSNARIVGIADPVDAKRQGGGAGGNLATGAEEKLDLTGVKTYSHYNELIQDPDLQLVSLCLPTPIHAEATIAALRAGKHVLCEKPMALTVEQCREMEQAQSESGKQLMIGHCLRYWPHYVKAQEIISSGKYGRVLYSRFHRSSNSPTWSWKGWIMDGSQSGGCVLDMHIHDVDTALWWFGKPEKIAATGYVWGPTPAFIDSVWTYKDGTNAYFHGAWDNNGGPFRMAFKVVMEHGTIDWDTAGNANIQLHVDQKTEEIPADGPLAYQAEIDDFIACISDGRKMERVVPEASRLAVELSLEELRQMSK